jgi:hypothetical protein
MLPTCSLVDGRQLCFVVFGVIFEWQTDGMIVARWLGNETISNQTRTFILDRQHAHALAL